MCLLCAAVCSVSRVMQVWAMNTRVFWIKHELMPELAKTEWCWLILVAIFSSNVSIFRTDASTAAEAVSENPLKVGYACLPRCLHLYACVTHMQKRHGSSFVNDFIVKCRAQAQAVNGRSCLNGSTKTSYIYKVYVNKHYSVPIIVFQDAAACACSSKSD